MKEALELEKMMNSTDIPQTTEKIREMKHSSRIRNDVNTLNSLASKYNRVSNEMYLNIAKRQAEFLYLNYRDIFNKILKNELNLSILYEFINILEQIENGDLNQHEGSQLVGQKLKELYIDSAVNSRKKTQEHLNKINSKQKYLKPTKKINYKQFKLLNEDTI
jgi:hypothetical protein